MLDPSEQITAYQVHSWSIDLNMGLALLRFRLPWTEPDKRKGLRALPPLVLTEQNCRELAANLLLQADRLAAKPGKA